MAMSRKNYIEFAGIIKHEIDSSEDLDSLAQQIVHDSAYRIAVSIARAFKNDNSSFDRQKFMEACGF